MKAAVEKHLTGEVGHVEDLVEVYLYAMRDRNVTRSIISTDSGALLGRMT